MTQVYVGEVICGARTIDCIGARITQHTPEAEARKIASLINIMSPLNGPNLPKPDKKTHWMVRPIAADTRPSALRVPQAVEFLRGQEVEVRVVPAMTGDELVNLVGRGAIRGIEELAEPDEKKASPEE